MDDRKSFAQEETLVLQPYPNVLVVDWAEVVTILVAILSLVLSAIGELPTCA